MSKITKQTVKPLKRPSKSLQEVKNKRKYSIISYFNDIIKKYLIALSTKTPAITLQNELENSKHLIAMATYLKTYYKECLENAEHKLEQVNNFTSKPSDESLKELELLRDFAKKCYEDASQRYLYEKNFRDIVQESIKK